ALSARRLCARWRADASGRRRRRGHQAADARLHGAVVPARAGAVVPRDRRLDLCRCRGRSGWVVHPGGGACPAGRERAQRAAHVRLLDPLSLPDLRAARRGPRAGPGAARNMVMTDERRGPPSLGEETANLMKRRRARNLALLVALLAFVVLVYIVSIVRMGGS